MARQRKRFIVIAPRYTFRGAKPCICTENEMLMILQKERRGYRARMDGPEGEEKEYTKFHTLVGVALVKVKQSDGRFLTKDVVSRAEYYNSRLPDPKFKPIYLIGHKIDFYMDKEDRPTEIQEIVDVLCKTNELDINEPPSMKSDESLFALIKFLNISKWWKTTESAEIKSEIRNILKEHRKHVSPAYVALMDMVM